MSKKLSKRAEEIKDLRKRHKLSRQKLADSLYHVKVERIADWELDRRNCPDIYWWAMKITWDKIDLWEVESETPYRDKT